MTDIPAGLKAMLKHKVRFEFEFPTQLDLEFLRLLAKKHSLRADMSILYGEKSDEIEKNKDGIRGTCLRFEAEDEKFGLYVFVTETGWQSAIIWKDEEESYTPEELVNRLQ